MEHGQEIALTLRDWFTANRPLIYFAYGLAFFILGLSISLQSRQYSRLNLARSLSWLGAFGFLHGLYEWGDVFIPIQGQFLSVPTVMLLHAVHYLILGLSFAFLFQFGVELFRPLAGRVRWIRMIPMALFISWLIIPYILGYQLMDSFDKWAGLVTSTARYGLCLPGSILAGLGLIKEARLQYHRMDLQRISRTLKIAAGALFTYAIFGGLVVDPSYYFPANILNTVSFQTLFILPPVIFRAIIGLILAVAIIRTLEVFNIETDRLIRRMEEKEVLANERERIARDLHDGALQQVYAAGLMAQSLRKKVDREFAGNMDRLIGTVNDAIDQLRGFLPQLKPVIPTIGILQALNPVIMEARRTVVVETEWDESLDPALKPEQITHLMAFVSEALSNAIRHSQTDKIRICLVNKEDSLQLRIRDFGKGLPKKIDEGYGLRNMHDRARLLGAAIRFDSIPGKGTTIQLDLPMVK